MNVGLKNEHECKIVIGVNLFDDHVLKKNIRLTFDHLHCKKYFHHL